MEIDGIEYIDNHNENNDCPVDKNSIVEVILRGLDDSGKHVSTIDKAGIFYWANNDDWDGNIIAYRVIQ